MANTKTVDLSEILKSDPFYSPDTLLDLNSYPHLAPLADAAEDTDDFAMPDRTSKGLGSVDLKKFLANPDRESISEMHDPDLLKKYDLEHGSGQTVYASNVPFQISYRDGK